MGLHGLRAVRDGEAGWSRGLCGLASRRAEKRPRASSAAKEQVRLQIQNCSPFPPVSILIRGKEMPSKNRLPGIKISDSLAPVGKGPTGNHKHKQKLDQETNNQFAASAAVHYETGNFTWKTALEARPDRGVPKAFFQGHTSACSGT